MPSNLAILEECLQARLAYAAAHNLNSVRGEIAGEGAVQNSFVLGKVTVCKGAVVANCIIDDKVTLIVEEGARISDCSFHPTLLDGKAVPVFIIVGANSMLFYTWSGESFECGSNTVIAYTKIHEMGVSYRMLQADSIVIGNNCILYGSYVHSNDDVDCPAHTKITIGNNAIIWHAGFVAHRGETLLGDDITICDTNTAFKLKHGKLRALKVTELESPNIETILGSFQIPVRVDVHNMSFTAGKNLYIGATVSMQHAFDKIKNGFVHLGDDVNVVRQSKDGRDDNTLQLNVHQFNAGNRVTLVCDSESWYSSRDPERYVEIGDDCTVILTVNNGGFKGLDKRVPSNSIVTL